MFLASFSRLFFLLGRFLKIKTGRIGKGNQKAKNSSSIYHLLWININYVGLTFVVDAITDCNEINTDQLITSQQILANFHFSSLPCVSVKCFQITKQMKISWGWENGSTFRTQRIAKLVGLLVCVKWKINEVSCLIANGLRERLDDSFLFLITFRCKPWELSLNPR